MQEIENKHGAIAISFDDVAESIRSRFSNTIFSYTMMHKSFGEEHEVYGSPIEMFGEHRIIAGLFNMDCYFSDLPYWESKDVAYVKDVAYDNMDGDVAVPLYPLVSHTLCMISAAAARGDESSIADILIGAVCHELLYDIRHDEINNQKETAAAEKRCLYLINVAEKVLENKKYRLWNRGHYYIYDLDRDDEERLLQALCTDVPDAGMVGDIIFEAIEHYITDCCFEIVCTKELSLMLYRYEQDVYQYIRDNGYDRDIKGNLADIERFRSSSRRLNDIPLSRDQNLPAVTDKRIDDFIERLGSVYIKKMSYAMARYCWRDLGIVEDSHAGSPIRCSYDLYVKVRLEMNDAVQRLLNDVSDKSVVRYLTLVSEEYHTWDPPKFINVEYDENVSKYLLNGAFLYACENGLALDDITMSVINHDIYNRAFTLAVRKTPQGVY